jgi:hypothetical protein
MLTDVMAARAEEELIASSLLELEPPIASSLLELEPPTGLPSELLELVPMSPTRLLLLESPPSLEELVSSSPLETPEISGPSPPPPPLEQAKSVNAKAIKIAMRKLLFMMKFFINSSS